MTMKSLAFPSKVGASDYCFLEQNIHNAVTRLSDGEPLISN
jgi:hypothetical protein